MAANTKDTVITGKLADSIVAWAKRTAVLEGKIEPDVRVTDTRVTRVWEGHYRVSLYTKYLPPANSLVPDYRILASYLVEVQDGVVLDRTRRPNSALND